MEHTQKTNDLSQINGRLDPVELYRVGDGHFSAAETN